MERDLKVAAIRICDILRNEYNLTLEQAVECIEEYGIIEYTNENYDMYSDFFYETNYNTWAKRMYDHYMIGQKKLKHNNKKA